MLAVPYSRVSSDQQLSGRGLTRQQQDLQAYCDQRGWTLYTGPGYTDAGVSAYSGDNLNTGALGRFLHDVRRGRFGSEPIALLIEDLDRFSRQAPLDVLPVLIDQVLGAGVTIAQVQRGRDISAATVKANSVELVELSLALSSAHQFSERLSARVADSHVSARAQIRQGKPIKPDSAPAWLSLVEGRWEINEYGESIRFLLDLAKQGLGCKRIADRLAQAGIPSPGQVRRNRWQQRTTRHTRNSTKTYEPVGWSASSVRQLLVMPQLTGARPVQKPGLKQELRDWTAECARLTRQGVSKRDLPKRPKREFLDPEPGYYPPLISEMEHQGILEAMQARRGTETGRIEQTRWIGMRHTFCHQCGGVVAGRLSKRKGYVSAYIACKGLPGQKCSTGYLPMGLAQAALLTRLSSASLSALFERSDTGQKQSTVAAAMAAVADAQAVVHQMDAALLAGANALEQETDAAVVGVLAKRQAGLHVKRDDAAKALAKAQQAALKAQAPDPGQALCQETNQRVRGLLSKFAQEQDTADDRYEVNRLVRSLGLRLTVDFSGERLGLQVADGEVDWQPLGGRMARDLLAEGQTDVVYAIDDIVVDEGDDYREVVEEFSATYPSTPDEIAANLKSKNTG